MGKRHSFTQRSNSTGVAQKQEVAMEQAKETAQTMTSNPLIGTWRLISWENRSVDGQKISYPLGKDAAGYIMYNEDGYMFVAISPPTASVKIIDPGTIVEA